MGKSIFRFRTNINCKGCILKITPDLDKHTVIKKWHVDINKVDKILTVEVQSNREKEVILAVEKSGFKIERIDFLKKI